MVELLHLLPYLMTPLQEPPSTELMLRFAIAVIELAAAVLKVVAGVCALLAASLALAAAFMRGRNTRRGAGMREQVQRLRRKTRAEARRPPQSTSVSERPTVAGDQLSCSKSHDEHTEYGADQSEGAA